MGTQLAVRPENPIKDSATPTTGDIEPAKAFKFECPGCAREQKIDKLIGLIAPTFRCKDCDWHEV